MSAAPQWGVPCRARKGATLNVPEAASLAVDTARTIRKHFDGGLACIRERLTNDLVEGIHNRLRVVARGAYGSYTAEALIERLVLVCSGIGLHPALPGPTGS